jgi:hypothetical protein
MHRYRSLRKATLILALLTAALAAQVGSGSHPFRADLLQRRGDQRQANPGTGIGSNPFILVDYPGGIALQYPTGINDKGTIVGSATLPDGSVIGYLLQGKAFKEIIYPGATLTGVLAINKTGLMVGAACIDVDCVENHGFSVKGKKFTTIDFPGSANTNPTAVNNSGDIAGYYGNPDLSIHGFFLHKGVFTSFDPPGSGETIVNGMNSHGAIVGWFLKPDNTGSGFILKNGTYTQVDYPGASFTDLDGLNDSGEIIGSYNVAGDPNTHGFLLSGGVFTSFDVPFLGSRFTFPNSINNNHQIVGAYGSNPPDFLFGFLTTY